MFKYYTINDYQIIYDKMYLLFIKKKYFVLLKFNNYMCDLYFVFRKKKQKPKVKVGLIYQQLNWQIMFDMIST